MQSLLVPGNRFRPTTIVGDGVGEHPLNEPYSQILQVSQRIREVARGPKQGLDGSVAVQPGGQQWAVLIRLWQSLQEAVCTVVDSSKASMHANRNFKGLRQTLEKKEGLFRMNMMGKRVNFAARSVIAPDPYISPSQVGVPVRFAKGLSFAEPVNSHNVHRLMRMVENGPAVWPGANKIELSNGVVLDLASLSDAQRIGHAKRLIAASSDAEHGGAPLAAVGAAGGSRARMAAYPKRVWRHLVDGDMVLMNRQPTLHKPSIMAQEVRVLRTSSGGGVPRMTSKPRGAIESGGGGGISAGQQTLRFHYANCKTFNADFDGDEMNMHFPQDYLAGAEARFIASAPR